MADGEEVVSSLLLGALNSTNNQYTNNRYAESIALKS
jgi:hypothetical protein